MKKLLSIFLTICLFLSCCLSPISAANKASVNSSFDFSIFSEDELQIYEEKLTSVHKQLEDQNAPPEIVVFYEEMLYQQMSAYCGKNVETQASNRVYAPDGGVATFYYNNYAGTHYIATAWTHFDKLDSYDYLLDCLRADAEFVAGDLIELLFGSLPHVGPAFSLLFMAESKIDDHTIISIDDADGYILVQNSKFVDSDPMYSVVTGWDTHDYIVLPETAVDSYIELF